MPKVFKPYLDKMGNSNANTFIGQPGELFYDPFERWGGAIANVISSEKPLGSAGLCTITVEHWQCNRCCSYV